MKIPLRLRLKWFLGRITLTTWIIWAIAAADLAAPGYLKFNFLLVQIDASHIRDYLPKN